MAYLIKVSLGEILDKLSILEIKLSYAKDANQIQNIKNEFNHLNDIAAPLWKLVQASSSLYERLNLSITSYGL